MASEKNPGIYFYSGFREKNTRGVQFEILKNPGIYFHSGFRKKIQVYTFIVALEKKKQGGVQFEILKNPGIDFYSGFRKTSQGGGVQIQFLKKVGPPVTSNPGSATEWDIARFLHIPRRSSIVLQTRWEAGHCLQVACWRV